MPLHVSSTVCSSSGGQNCITQHLVSSHTEASDIKLVSLYSTIKMMHGPINMRLILFPFPLPRTALFQGFSQSPPPMRAPKTQFGFKDSDDDIHFMIFTQIWTLYVILG